MSELTDIHVQAAPAEARPPQRRLAPLPIEGGRPRVQRLVEELPPVHLELAPPIRDRWTLDVGGLVDFPIKLALSDLRELGVVAHQSDFHCVWGWSRPSVNWVGVSAGRVLDAVRPRSGATHVRFGAADSPYASCVPIEHARDGLFAFELEGEPLPPLNGGPLRWVQPHYLWGYKGVKWVCSVELTDQMDPGPWETKVGDLKGEVPQGIIDRFAELDQADEAEARG